MHVLVIGAGVIGMTTAWALARDGHQVTVLDAGPEPASGASHANGAQLSYSYVAPLAGPSIWKDLPKLLFGRDAPVRFRPGLDLRQYRWGLRFLAACTAGKARRTTQALLRLAFLSRDVLAGARDLQGLDFDHVQAGKLVVYSSAESFAAAAAQARFQNALGCKQDVLDAAACLALEPALRPIAGRLVGGIFTPDDAAADPRKLCHGLLHLLEGHNNGVAFHFNTPVIRLLREGQRLAGVETANGRFRADAYVLAGGIQSAELARGIGLDLPLYPIKGYSLTLDIANENAAPRVSVTDYGNKVVYARLGQKLRVAGMADIVGADMALEPDRVTQLSRQAAATFPVAAPEAAQQPWCGLRPATPGGRPILGHSGIDGLWLNVGHGALGLTLAFGSAASIAAGIAGRPELLDMADFALHA
ncbi:D-amino acid dehydrogenase [Ferrovibrio sp.]|uniref:D-amino acid dehydrogenase n=1 Tax=Ferrovibrio sp. TaxID=1917215 RepID=UPI001B7C6BC5|nr:D-amino acid dehydrogenase [Ferrovibrio sp.]MBP7063370.1 D-amino acid dehydrogenase [Ferrovibrio sp.]